MMFVDGASKMHHTWPMTSQKTRKAWLWVIDGVDVYWVSLSTVWRSCDTNQSMDLGLWEDNRRPHDIASSKQQMAYTSKA